MAKKKYWQKAEKKAAKLLQMEIVPRSGAGPTLKGDLRCRKWYGDGYMGEVKSSTRVDCWGRPFIGIRTEWFAKAKQQAHEQGVTPIMIFVFGHDMETYAFKYNPFLEPSLQYPTVSQKVFRFNKDVAKSYSSGMTVNGEVWELL